MNISMYITIHLGVRIVIYIYKQAIIELVFWSGVRLLLLLRVLGNCRSLLTIVLEASFGCSGRSGRPSNDH